MHDVTHSAFIKIKHMIQLRAECAAGSGTFADTQTFGAPDMGNVSASALPTQPPNASICVHRRFNKKARSRNRLPGHCDPRNPRVLQNLYVDPSVCKCQRCPAGWTSDGGPPGVTFCYPAVIPRYLKVEVELATPPPNISFASPYDGTNMTTAKSIFARLATTMSSPPRGVGNASKTWVGPLRRFGAVQKDGLPQLSDVSAFATIFTINSTADTVATALAAVSQHCLELADAGACAACRNATGWDICSAAALGGLMASRPPRLLRFALLQVPPPFYGLVPSKVRDCWHRDPIPSPTPRYLSVVHGKPPARSQVIKCPLIAHVCNAIPHSFPTPPQNPLKTLSAFPPSVVGRRLFATTWLTSFSFFGSFFTQAGKGYSQYSKEGKFAWTLGKLCIFSSYVYPVPSTHTYLHTDINILVHSAPDLFLLAGDEVGLVSGGIFQVCEYIGMLVCVRVSLMNAYMYIDDHIYMCARLYKCTCPNIYSSTYEYAKCMHTLTFIHKYIYSYVGRRYRLHALFHLFGGHFFGSRPSLPSTNQSDDDRGE